MLHAITLGHVHSFHQSLQLLGLLAIVCQLTQNKLNRSLVWGLGSIQWRAENLNMSLLSDLHETPIIQRDGYRYSDTNTSPLYGLGKMGAIWLNTHPPRISISLHDVSLPHFATVEIRNHKGRLNVLSAVIPYSKPLMIV